VRAREKERDIQTSVGFNFGFSSEVHRNGISQYLELKIKTLSIFL
jgi:hypothetical protein